MKLRDALPREFFNGEYEDTRVMKKYLDVEVVKKHDGCEDAWIGKEKFVYVWWELANGYAVGMNENPSRGMSFPVKKMRN